MLFRKLLADQLELHAAGRDPMNVYRGASPTLALPMEHTDRGLGGSRSGNPMTTFLRTHAKYSARVNEAARLLDVKLGLLLER